MRGLVEINEERVIELKESMPAGTKLFVQATIYAGDYDTQRTGVKVRVEFPPKYL